jgi:plastocyanin
MRVLLIVATTALVFLAACGQSLDDVEPQAADTVSVEDNSFGPRVIEVAPGTEVTWTWDGDRQHNVSGDGWQSETIDSGSFERTFARPGTYDYRCTLHPGMTGRVVVSEQATSR